MTLPTRPAVAAALRSTADPEPPQPTRRSKKDPPLVVLRKRVETILFYAFSIAPVDALLDRSLEALKANPDWIEMNADELVDAWESEVHHLRANYALDPESWGDEKSLAFRKALSAAFGCRGRNVIRLLLEFYRMPEPRRLAILVLLERSASFTYLVEQVDNAPPMPVENARESMAMLMKRVWGEK